MHRVNDVACPDKREVVVVRLGTSSVFFKDAASSRNLSPAGSRGAILAMAELTACLQVAVCLSESCLVAASLLQSQRSEVLKSGSAVSVMHRKDDNWIEMQAVLKSSQPVLRPF